MNMQVLAEEFARSVWRCAASLRIKDLALYGSTAMLIQGRLARHPKDVDMLILHSGNTVFQRYQEEEQKRKDLGDAAKCQALFAQLSAEGYETPDLHSSPIVKTGLLENMLNVSFLDVRFFSDPEYAEFMRALNLRSPKPGPRFYEKIFEYALLYNPHTGRFDAPASAKYQVKQEVEAVASS
jgi:hypothetical protein